MADDLTITRTNSEITIKWNFHPWDQLKSTTRGQKLCSPIFEYNSHKWCLDFYPNGYKSSTPGFSSFYLLIQNVKQVLNPIKVDFDLFVENQKVSKLRTSYTYGNQSSFESWGFTDFVTVASLESDYVCENRLSLGITIQDGEKIKIEEYLVPLSLKLYENSKNGDVTIYCKDMGVVRGDYVVLLHDSFCNATFHFEESLRDVQGREVGLEHQMREKVKLSDTQKVTDEKAGIKIHLLDYSVDSVTRMIKYLYTGFTTVSEELELRCELYFLADFTTNSKLCDIVIEEIIKRDFQPSKIIDLLLQLRFKPLPLRKLAVEFYQNNRAVVVKEPDYDKRLDELLGSDGDPDLVREMLS